jgi:hypothetical protein
MGIQFVLLFQQVVYWNKVLFVKNMGHKLSGELSMMFLVKLEREGMVIYRLLQGKNE